MWLSVQWQIYNFHPDNHVRTKNDEINIANGKLKMNTIWFLLEVRYSPEKLYAFEDT